MLKTGLLSEEDETCNEELDTVEVVVVTVVEYTGLSLLEEL